MIKSLLVLIGLACGSPVLAQQPPAQVGGDGHSGSDAIYKVAPRSGAEGSVLTFLQVKVDQGRLSGIDLVHGADLSGDVVGSAMHIRLADATVDVMNDDDEGRLAGTLTDKDGTREPIVLHRLHSVWQCGNHRGPSHVAETAPEVAELTRSKQCERWRRVR